MSLKISFRVVIATLILSGGLQSISAAAKQKPNVLLLIVDDANPDLFSTWQRSPVATPNIERLARTSTWFMNAHTQPGCCVSRTSLLLGLRPTTSGIYYNAQSYREAGTWVETAENLPARFKRAGYTVAGYGKIFHNRFQEVEEAAFSPGQFFPYSNELELEINDHVLPGSMTRIPGGPSNYDWGQLPDSWDRDDPAKMQQDTLNALRAVEFLQAEHDAPFFLSYGCWRPHVRWTVPQRYFERFPLESIETPPGFKPDDLEDLPPPARWIATQRGFHDQITRAGLWKRAIQGLYAATAYADEQIGRVLDALEASPHRDNTIVVFLSDNGWHVGEKNHWSKFTLWSQSSRIPLGIRVPGQSARLHYDPVSTLDLFPTLVALTGLGGPSTHELEGTDLSPVLKGGSGFQRQPVVITHGPGNHAVQDARFRYLRYRDGSEELYDTIRDRYEWTNLAGDARFVAIKENLAAFLPAHEAVEAPYVVGDINIVTEDAFSD